MSRVVAVPAEWSSATVRINFGGELMRLLPGRAVLWSAADMLLIADTHFGKGEVFRRHGIAIPSGSTDSGMQRIDRLLKQYPVQQVVVLGDFLHGKPSTELIHKVAEWSSNLPARLIVVKGNHDRHLAEKPALWQHITMLPELRLRGLTLQHDPATESPLNRDFSGHVLCGHIHPVARLGSGRSDRLRMPVFWQQLGRDGEQLVLPSFGDFTGGYRVEPAAGTRLFVAGDEAVMAI